MSIIYPKCVNHMYTVAKELDAHTV